VFWTVDGQRNNQLSAWLGPDSEHVWRHQDRATPMRKFPDNSEALAAFIGRKTNIDTILARPAGLNAEHFNCERSIFSIVGDLFP
jgi:hypothetical protein